MLMLTNYFSDDISKEQMSYLLSIDDEQEAFNIRRTYPDKIIGFRLGTGNFKYIVTIRHNDKIYNIRFGNINYEHFRDRLLHYRFKDHYNDKRRELYLRRASKIHNKNGDLTANDPTSANYWSIRIFWGS